MSDINRLTDQDPILKQAAADIQEIFKKYDIAGLAVLHTTAQVEYTIRLDPSYSIVRLNNKNLEITPPLVDPNEPERAGKKVRETLNMLINLRLHTTKLVQSLGMSEIYFRQEMKIPIAKPLPPGAPPSKQ